MGQFGMWVEAKNESCCMTVTFRGCLERQQEARENLPNEQSCKGCTWLWKESYIQETIYTFLGSG